MSTELYLVCHDCGSGIWAGCDGSSGHQFLWKNEQEMKAIGNYLGRHIGHRLGYETEHFLDDKNYELRSGAG